MNARQANPYDASYWAMHTFSMFIALFLAIVLGLMVTGYLLREYLRANVNQPAPKLSNPR